MTTPALAPLPVCGLAVWPPSLSRELPVRSTSPASHSLPALAVGCMCPGPGSTLHYKLLLLLLPCGA